MLQNTILGISPGRSRLGFGVFRDDDLLYYGGKSLCKFKTKTLVLSAVGNFLKFVFTKYKVGHVALPKLIKQQESSPLLVSVFRQIKIVSRQSNVSIHEYHLIFIRQHLCKPGKPTKENTTPKLAEQYPELNRYLKRTSPWERRYYGYIFNAVAAGAICTEELKKPENNKNV